MARPLQPVSGGARFLLGLMCIVLVVGAWALVTESGLVGRGLLPSPAATARAGWSLFAEQYFGVDVGLTIGRVAIGFAIAAVLAIPLGVKQQLAGMFSVRSHQPTFLICSD